MSVKAEWSGQWPSLCIGEWKLIVDGKDVSEKIPEDLRDRSMDTFGTYQSWHFENWMEVFESYEDGLLRDDWIDENDYWLSNITDDQHIKEQIYDAINAEDFRSNSCGGCI